MAHPLQPVSVGESRQSSSLTKLGMLAAGLAGLYVLFFWRLGACPLMPPNEGLYAEIAREMNESGDYLTPHLNHLRYYEKPPLLYWCVAASMRAFGDSEFAARLPLALSGAMAVFVTLLIGRLMGGRRLGASSAVVVGTAVGMFAMCRLTMFDPMLMLWTSVAFLGFTAAVAAPRHTTSWSSRLEGWGGLIWAAGLALGVMTKGPVALAISLPPMLAYVGLTGTWRQWRRMRLWSSALVFLAIAAPWHIALALRDPHFGWFYFVNETWHRFTGTRIPADYRTDHWYFYLIRTVLLFAPWSLLLPSAILAYPRRSPGDQEKRDEEEGGWRSAYLLGLLWFLWPLVMFSLSKNKANYYMLPAFPAQALLVGRLWCLFRNGQVRAYVPNTLVVCSFAAMVVGALFGLWRAETQPPRLIAELDAAARMGVIWPLRGMMAFWIAAGAMGLVGRVRSRAIWPLAMGTIGLTLAVGPLIARHGDQFSDRRAAFAASRFASDGAPILMDGLYECRSTVGYYLHRRIACIEGKGGDLWFGGTLEPSEEWFPSTAAVIERIRRGERLVLIVPSPERRGFWLQDGGAVVVDRGKYRDTWILTANVNG